MPRLERHDAAVREDDDHAIVHRGHPTDQLNLRRRQLQVRAVVALALVAVGKPGEQEHGIRA
jgi:hypothetical protein